jgi:putative DNA primase/helicase
MTKPTITPELIRAALGYLLPDVPRDAWARVGMAIKSEYPDETGLALFDEWSARGQSYEAKAVRSTWKSLKASGGVTVATLLHEAQQSGFDLAAHAPAPQPSSGQLAQQERERKAKVQREREQTEAAQLAAAAKAQKRWRAALEAPPEGLPTYPSRKSVQAHGLRFEAEGTALVPLRDAEGKLWNVQTLAPAKIEGQPDKLFLKGGRKSGLWHMLGSISEPKQPPAHAEYSQSAIVCIAEGYATAASVHEATGWPVACAFDAGNIASVARALRKLHPSACLVIAGDDDHETQAATGRNAGREKAQAAAQAVKGCAVFPQGLQAGESDWNDLHARLGLDVVREQITQALHESEQSPSSAKGVNLSPFEGNPQQAESEGKTEPAQYEDKRFAVSESGVWFTGLDNEGRPKLPLKLCSRLEVTAGTRDFEGGSFGYLLEFDDPLGRCKLWPMPARMLAGDGNEYRSVLLSMGLRIEPGGAAKNLLTSYIQSRRPQAWAHCTDRTGWHRVNDGEPRAVYVQPRRSFGDSAEHRVIFQSDSGMENTFREAGTLGAWRDQVAALCVGNSRLVFAVSCAFAGLAMKWVGAESGGFHLRGDSSGGKTTALRVAASVFGGDSFMQRWRATDNALEAIAAQHCDSLLVLDELAQVDPKQAGSIAYMLGNGQSKARANRSALPKPFPRWNLLFLSAGEVGLAQHVAEGGNRVRAGQEVRMVDIPADAGAGYGAFERLHGIDSPAGFSEGITKACSRVHGTAAPAFIAHLIEHQGSIAQALRQLQNDIAQFIPEPSAGQVHRVGRRFALVAAAGELAAQAGITGWSAGEATQAARKCFEAWLLARGGLGNAEEYQVMTCLHRYFQQNAEGHFKWMHRVLDDRAPDKGILSGYRRFVEESGKAIHSNTEYQRAFGERMSEVDAQHTQTEFIVYPEIFKSVICKDFDHKTGLRLLREKGILDAESDTRFTKKVKLPGIGEKRMLVIKSSILAGDDE